MASDQSHHVFISYSRDDKARIEPLVSLIEAEGWDVWWDEEIPPGESYDKVIEAAATQAGCVVVIWSATSVESDWVVAEAALGREHDKLIPVAIDDVRIPLEFRRLQCAMLHDAECDRAHPEVEKFLEAVRAAVTGTRAPSEPSASKVTQPAAPAGSTGADSKRWMKPVIAAASLIVVTGAAWWAYTSISSDSDSPDRRALAALTTRNESRLGPLVVELQPTSISVQPFERGFMLWRQSESSLIHVCTSNGDGYDLSSFNAPLMDGDDVQAQLRQHNLENMERFAPYDGGYVRVWLGENLADSLGEPVEDEVYPDKVYDTWTVDYQNGFVVGPYNDFITSQERFDPHLIAVWGVITAQSGTGACVKETRADQ